MRVLLAFVVALAAAVPVGVRAMPMLLDAAGTVVGQRCPDCAQHAGTSSHPGQMPACQVLACAGAVATLPAPVLLPGRIVLRTAYAMALPTRRTGTAPAPEPLPPRPVVLG